MQLSCLNWRLRYKGKLAIPILRFINVISRMESHWPANSLIKPNDVQCVFCQRKVLWTLNIQGFERWFWGHSSSLIKSVLPCDLHGDPEQKHILTYPKDSYSIRTLKRNHCMQRDSVNPCPICYDITFTDRLKMHWKEYLHGQKEDHLLLRIR